MSDTPEERLAAMSAKPVEDADAYHARKIREAAAVLNASVAEAREKGLRVELDIETRRYVSEPSDVPIVVAAVYRKVL